MTCFGHNKLIFFFFSSVPSLLKANCVMYTRHRGRRSISTRRTPIAHVVHLGGRTEVFIKYNAQISDVVNRVHGGVNTLMWDTGNAPEDDLGLMIRNSVLTSRWVLHQPSSDVINASFKVGTSCTCVNQVKSNESGYSIVYDWAFVRSQK